jgi:hypothetical protein
LKIVVPPTNITNPILSKQQNNLDKSHIEMIIFKIFGSKKITSSLSNYKRAAYMKQPILRNITLLLAIMLAATIHSGIHAVKSKIARLLIYTTK